MTKILVTGAAGFIGSHVCEALRERGDVVVGVDNLNDYYDTAQKRENVAIIKEAGASFHEADIRDDAFSRIAEQETPDAIIHVAAMAGVRYSVAHPDLYFDVNVVGTQRVLSAAKALGIPVVAASSSSVYGGRTDVPFTETDRVDEQISPYAASKRAMELACHVHHHLTGLPVTCLRFFTVYGPRGRPDMAPYLFMRLILDGKPIQRFGDGSSARDYTYVGDIVQGVLAALDHADGFTIYNLGNSSPATLSEFIETMERVCQKPAEIVEKPVPPGDVPITYADITKAREELGYDPGTNLEDGLRKQYEWFTG